MQPILYANAPLDRAQIMRRDPTVMTDLRQRDDMIVIPQWKDLSLINHPLQAALFLQGHDARGVLQKSDRWVFLGLWDGAPLFAVQLTDAHQPELPVDGHWENLRTIGAALPHDHAAVLGCARSLLLWQGRNRFCGQCGSATIGQEGGHVMVCTNQDCGTSHYPRTDPAVIMLVEDGDKVLLHRQHGWAAGMWSILAGFVEPGETLEEAVAREVHEETGILVDGITYASCQPWPFPGSLMIGFTARAAGGRLAHDPHELEDARWFSRDEIKRDFKESNRATGDGPYMPKAGSISNRLLSAWLNQE